MRMWNAHPDMLDDLPRLRGHIMSPVHDQPSLRLCSLVFLYQLFYSQRREGDHHTSACAHYAVVVLAH